MTARVSILLKSRASPDVLPFSLCNKKRLCNSAHKQTPLSNDTIGSVLPQREVSRAKDLSAPLVQRHPNAVSNLELERLRYVGPVHETRKGRCAGMYIGERLLLQSESTLCGSNCTPLIVHVMNVALHSYSDLYRKDRNVS